MTAADSNDILHRPQLIEFGQSIFVQPQRVYDCQIGSIANNGHRSRGSNGSFVCGNLDLASNVKHFGKDLDNVAVRELFRKSGHPSIFHHCTISVHLLLEWVDFVGNFGLKAALRRTSKGPRGFQDPLRGTLRPFNPCRDPIRFWIHQLYYKAIELAVMEVDL